MCTFFSSANKCLAKVADYSAQMENYEKAIEIYEQVGQRFDCVAQHDYDLYMLLVICVYFKIFIVVLYIKFHFCRTFFSMKHGCDTDSYHDFHSRTVIHSLVLLSFVQKRKYKKEKRKIKTEKEASYWRLW